MKFSGRHFPKDVILQAVRWYVVYPLGSRMIEEMVAERRIALDQTTINCWVNAYAPKLESLHRKQKPVGQPHGAWMNLLTICQSRHLNNIVEQDHRFVKRLTRPMMQFKAFYSALATHSGIELSHGLREGRYSDSRKTAPWEYFYPLTEQLCLRSVDFLFALNLQQNQKSCTMGAFYGCSLKYLRR